MEKGGFLFLLGALVDWDWSGVRLCGDVEDCGDGVVCWVPWVEVSEGKAHWGGGAGEFDS